MRWTCVLALVLLAVGCDESVAPEAENSAAAPFLGSFDQSNGSFVWERIEISVPGGGSVPIELVGSNVEVDDEYGFVRVDVAMFLNLAQFLSVAVSGWFIRRRRHSASCQNM